MKKSYILSFLAAAAIMGTGCSKEDPFGPGSEGEGQVLKSALAMEIDADGIEVRTTRAAEANIDDFTILFNSSELAQPIKYRYGEMPEIVALPAGEYTVTASYGENRDAAWDCPLFLGVSEQFTVRPMEITSYIEPIMCKLENIMVSIDFDPVLREHMSPDSYVEVKVGQSSALNFGLDEANAGKAGYFAHQEEISLVAVFHGTVDGNSITETKSMKNIEKGNHYKITFKLHQGSEPDLSGSLSGSLDIDASVTVVNVERNVPLIEDQPLDDSERPSEGQNPDDGKDDPVQPDDPAAPAPVITADAPVELDKVNDGTKLTSCVLHINSYHEDGIVELYCDINSPALTSEDLQEFGLDTHLDLVNTPAAMQDGLKQLGLPYLVRGEKEVEFDISSFIAILGSVSEGMENQFTITVKDANGTCTKTLRIQF